jgi:hypothetical protein
LKGGVPGAARHVGRAAMRKMGEEGEMDGCRALRLQPGGVLEQARRRGNGGGGSGDAFGDERGGGGFNTSGRSGRSPEWEQL